MAFASFAVHLAKVHEETSAYQPLMALQKLSLRLIDFGREDFSWNVMHSSSDQPPDLLLPPG